MREQPAMSIHHGTTHLDATALTAFGAGQHVRAWQLLGAHVCEQDGVRGTRFATWAPNARAVRVLGDFNHWQGGLHAMQPDPDSGVWQLFVPDLRAGHLYKFEITDVHGQLKLKTDPYGRQFECRPGTAAIVTAASQHVWTDADWLERRGGWQSTALSIYEVHLGSWQRHEDGGFYSYAELADSLIPHVQALGFTHIELLPVTEHPLDQSWGYQTTGYFAPTSRHGTPDEFRSFINRAHEAGIGVLLDWVPGHFPRDEHALARFDGTALYEHEGIERGEHPEWGTLVFNFGRNEVRSFLISSALYWLEEFHLDGLRVDAVASMLYLDYARKPGQWLPNRHGGRENLEAIDFLRELNTVTHRECTGSITIAEESTAWPQVSRPVYLGGLGFTMKWNMGWMHDTLDYLGAEPIYRQFNHQALTFGMMYAYTENFVLPFSHDEVVHGKRSLLGRMPGDEWQQFANLRLLLTYQFSYPGKKLLFMGAELANPWEWNDAVAMPHFLAQDRSRQGIAALLADLNHLYRKEPALFAREFETEGFAWIDCHDASQSVISFERKGADQNLIVVLNFTPVVRENYRIGVHHPGSYREILNSDAAGYGGSNVGNLGQIESEPTPWMGRDHSLCLRLPPLAALWLKPLHQD